MATADAAPLTAGVIPDSGRRLAIVTGANNGFGFALTELLLAKGYDVVMACRDVRLAHAAAERLSTRSSAGSGTATVIKLDLADLTSVCAFADEFQAAHGNRRIDLLVNNAGLVVIGGTRKVTAQGFEMTVGVNHLGHAALFNLLLPQLLRSHTRCVAVSSLAHRGGTLAAGAPLDGATGWAAYSNSKLLNTVWGFEVQRRFGASGVTCNSGHPGSGLYTGMGGRTWLATVLRSTLIPLLTPLAWLAGFSQTWRQGGVAELAAAEAAEGGQYFYRHTPAEASAHARDAAVGAWVWSETQRVLAAAAAAHGLRPQLSCTTESVP